MKTTKLVMIILMGLSLMMGAESLKNKSGTTPTFKEVLGLKSPGSISISPNGQYILYTVRETDWEKNTYRSQIWMAVVKSGELKQMTFVKKSNGSVQWAPNSQYFSFRSAREKKSQIYLMSATGGEARPITKFKTGFSSYRWSPDGKWIAYTAGDEKTKQQTGIEKKYGEFTIIDKELNPSHLWILNVDSGKTKKIVDRDDLHVTSIAWSPDGKKIAFSANPDSRILSFSKSDIYVVTVADKKIKHLVKQKGPDSAPLWSPDGKTIAFSSSMGTETYFVNSEICTIPADGGSINCLTKAFDEDAYPYYWKKAGIYFVAFQGMTRHMFRLNPTNGSITQITKGNMMLRGGSMSRNGRLMAFSYVNNNHYGEVYYSPVKKFKPVKLTHFSNQLNGWKLSTKEAISWTSKDGAEITGVLIKPADFNPQKKYPLFVIIHGGPTGISYPQKFDFYNTYYPIEQWAAKGAVFLEPNYRGSAGFGSAFRKLNYRNLGVGDYWDVISGVDHLINLGFVDKDRVAAMGWSQGGYISAYITTFSDRFAAVSVGAGISDWVTYYYRTDITPFTLHYLGNNPWKDPEIYKKTSPMTHILNAKTPTLIQHGEFDRRVPPTNAYKLYRGLQDLGIPSKLIIYKGFGHGISKPKEKLAVLTHNWNWFNKYIYGEEAKEERFDKDNKDNKKKK
jgi:dipeptidyl aminopeptidase/acylaminoacyl peptidase